MASRRWRRCPRSSTPASIPRFPPTTSSAGLMRLRRRERRAFAQAKESRGVEDFHEWRKRAEGAPVRRRARRLGGNAGAAGAGEGAREPRARSGERHRPLGARARDRTPPRRGRDSRRASPARDDRRPRRRAVGRAARPRIAPLRGRPEDVRAPGLGRARLNSPPAVKGLGSRLPRPHVPVRARRRRLARFRLQGDRARAGRDRVHGPRPALLPSGRRRAIRSSRCGRTSSTATSRRSARSPTSSPGASRSASASRPTTPRGTRRRSRHGSRAPTGTSSSAPSTGSRATGSMRPSPLRAASHREGAERLYAEYYRLLAKAARTRLFDVLTHFDLPKKHGHRPARALEEAEDEAIAAARECRLRRRDLLGRACASPSARPTRSRGSCDVSSRRACP